MISFLSYKQKKVFDEYKNYVGDVVGIVFDINLEKIVGFTYKKSFLKYDFFLIENIIQDESGFLSIKSGKDNVGIGDYYDLIGKQVKNRDGKTLGSVYSVEFDAMFNLKDLVIDSGYNVYSLKVIPRAKISIQKGFIKISKKAVISYEKDFVLVDDNTLVKENKKALEKISKVFISMPSPSYIMKAKYGLFK